MLPAFSPPLDQSELMRLEYFLRSAACGRDAMSLSHAHGFLTAGVSGPEALSAEEWIRLVFDEPVFANGAQAEEMLGLIMRLYRDIESSLGTGGRFQPVLEYVRDGRGSVQLDAHAWCEGFISGISLFREHWTRAARASLRQPLELIFHLAEARPEPGEAYARLCEALPLAAEAIYRFWHGEDAA